MYIADSESLYAFGIGTIPLQSINFNFFQTVLNIIMEKIVV